MEYWINIDCINGIDGFDVVILNCSIGCIFCIGINFYCINLGIVDIRKCC